MVMAAGPALSKAVACGLVTKRRLRSVGAGPQAVLFAERLSAAGHFAIFLQHDGHPERFRFDREPDGRPAPPWAWDDVVTPAAQLQTPANEDHKRDRSVGRR